MSFYYLLPPSRHSCNSIREGYSKARKSRRRRLLKSALDLSNFENWISNELREAWRVAVRWIRFLFGILRNSFRNDIDNDLLLQRVNDTIPSCWYLKAKSSYLIRNGAVRDNILQFIHLGATFERTARFWPTNFHRFPLLNETKPRRDRYAGLESRPTFRTFSSSIHDRSRVI